MIVSHLIWLLNSLHLAASYRYLPKNEIPTYSYGAKTAYHRSATLSDIPFHVLIVYNNLYCSGTLVRSKIVITAASCLLTAEVKRRPVVKVGADSITGPGQIIPVVDIKIHEYYKYMSRIDNDIAMLVLQEHVQFNNHVKKAIVVESDVALRTGASIEVSGFGSTNLAQAYVNQLIWTEMLVIGKEECDKIHQHLRTPSNFCAKYSPERRLSDNGGPAMYNRELLVGILSYGGTSSNDPHVAIFTNISYFHSRKTSTAGLGPPPKRGGFAIIATLGRRVGERSLVSKMHRERCCYSLMDLTQHQEIFRKVLHTENRIVWRFWNEQ